MRYIEIIKALNNYFFRTGHEAYNIEVPTVIRSELDIELGASITSINGVPVNVAPSLPADRIVLDGPAGIEVYPLLPNNALGYPHVNPPLGHAQPMPQGLASGAGLQQMQQVPKRGWSYGIDYAKPFMEPACECGSEKVGSPAHSSWCPKHGN